MRHRKSIGNDERNTVLYISEASKRFVCVCICPSGLQKYEPLCCLGIVRAAQKAQIIFQANLSWVDTRSIKQHVLFSPPPLSSFLSILMVEGHPSKK